MEDSIVKKLKEELQPSTQQNQTEYSNAVIENLNKNVQQTNKLVRNQIRNTQTNESILERNKRVRIVRKPKDQTITNSKNLHTKFNEHFPNVSFSKAYISAGGSFIFEFSQGTFIDHRHSKAPARHH